MIMAPLKGKIENTVNEKERNEYHLMYRNADRLLKLIDQLLDLSKLEDRSIELEKPVVETNHFFKIIAASFSSLAEHKKINFVSDVPGQNTHLEFDPDIIQKVCNNLLSNAFKFTPEGGKIDFMVNYHQEKLTITVSDSGSGIPKEDQYKVFDRFFQSSNGTHLGTGIGLALTKELVEFHGGIINLKSAQNVGSNFTVTIPVKKAEAMETKPAITRSPIPIHERLSFNNTSENDLSDESPVILIIEDNPDLRSYLSETLNGIYSVHLSENGADGISKAKEIIPDLIISDVMMPEKDGMEVCRELKEATETNHVPIILLTARADQESKLEGLTIGADDYLLKPFDPVELKARISNLLEQRSKLKEKYAQMLLLEPTEMEITSSEELFLKTATEVVSKHIEDSGFSAEQFCSEMEMSRMQLHRKLTALTGQSATAFVRHQRLMRASQLLQAGEPVSQVGYAVGFSSLSYFTKNFKQEFGISPSEYGLKVG